MALDSTLIERIRAAIVEIEKLDVHSIVATQVGSEMIEEAMVGRYKAPEFCSLVERSCKQLRNSIDGSNALLLPHCIYWDVGGVGMTIHHIADVVESLLRALNAADLQASQIQLEVLIGYQISSGYWEKPVRDKSRVDERTLLDITHRMELLLVSVRSLESETRSLSDKFRSEEQAHASFLSQVRTDAEQSHADKERVAALLVEVSNSDGQVKGILAAQETNLSQSKGQLTAIGDQQITLNARSEELAKILEQSGGQLKYLEEKRALVEEIAGTAATGILGTKFEMRKKELESSARFWMVAIAVAVVASCVWLAVSHLYIRVSNDNVWMVLAANFGLLLPALFLIGFTAKQFSQERRYQEEYAFRSSVAMTVKAFSDTLGADSPDRTKLVLETVERLYQLPLSLRDPEADKPIVSSKDALDAIGAIKELVKEVKK